MMVLLLLHYLRHVIFGIHHCSAVLMQPLCNARLFWQIDWIALTLEERRNHARD